MSKPKDPLYWKHYRDAHLETIRARDRERKRQPERRVARHVQEVARRKRRREEQRVEPIPSLPGQRGLVYSFWEDELRADLYQEAKLAILEGKDPRMACARYRGREHKWRRMTTWLPPE